MMKIMHFFQKEAQKRKRAVKIEQENRENRARIPGKWVKYRKVRLNCQKEGGIFSAFVIGAYWIFARTLL